MKGRATVHVAASREAVYDAVSDIERMGDWSPECRGGTWIDGAACATVGARFTGSNRRGLARWSTTSRVVIADRGRTFAFVTGHRSEDMTRWTYGFETDPAGGTAVSECFEMLNDMPWYFRVADRCLMGVKDRRADLETNMANTLQRLKAALESEPTTDVEP
jgi:hypothetical protein